MKTNIFTLTAPFPPHPSSAHRKHPELIHLVGTALMSSDDHSQSVVLRTEEPLCCLCYQTGLEKEYCICNRTGFEIFAQKVTISDVSTAESLLVIRNL